MYKENVEHLALLALLGAGRRAASAGLAGAGRGGLARVRAQGEVAGGAVAGFLVLGVVDLLADAVLDGAALGGAAVPNVPLTAGVAGRGRGQRHLREMSLVVICLPRGANR